MKIEFNTDNAIFEEDFNNEVQRILEKVSEKLENGATEGSVSDINGNSIGYWTL